MTTKIYTVQNTIRAGWALHEIATRIPCFINGLEDVDTEVDVEPIDWMLQITCREADLAFVEKMLAEFV